MKNILKVCHLKKYYEADDTLVKAVDDISFDVKDGEFLGIMGPSGSGKSTLLNVISTISSISDGSIFIDDEEINKMEKSKLTQFRREKLGFIFQEFNLLDTLSIYDNIAIALTINKYPPKKIKEKIMRIAELMGIEGILNKYPYEVSGGQRQRCACVRAVITNPKLLLADEPTGALDSGNAQRLLEHLIYMNESLGTSVLLVTHDIFSASYCRRILFLKDGKIFKELVKANKSRGEFLDEILSVISVIGGGSIDLRKTGN